MDHDRYRKELLHQCLVLFAEHGYGSITMRQIAQGLGVSTGALYHYFPSKEEIFMQLVQELCAKDIADFFAHAPSVAPPEERLKAVVAFFVENYSFYQQQVLLLIEFYQHSQRKAFDNMEFLRGCWRQTSEQLRAYLQLSPEQVDFVLIFMDGLLLQCLYNSEPGRTPLVEQQSQLLVDLLFKA